MSCLIIGDGPSSKNIEKHINYNVDSVIGIHRSYNNYTNLIITLDLREFKDKEQIGLDNNISLIFGTNYKKSFEFLKKYEHLVKLIDVPNLSLTSGSFAIFWAIQNGYKNIYTAGIDYVSETNEFYPSEHALSFINKYLQEWNQKANIYKISKISKINAIVKSPPINL